MSREYREYEISTLTDIFNKVPANRIMSCMAELAELLTQAASMKEAILASAESDGIKIDPDKLMRMPESITWKDDGSGDLEFSLNHVEHGELVNVKTKMEHPE